MMVKNYAATLSSDTVRLKYKPVSILGISSRVRENSKYASTQGETDFIITNCRTILE